MLPLWRCASCRVVSCRVVSCRVVSCRVVSCRVVSCRVVSCRVVSFRACDAVHVRRRLQRAIHEYVKACAEKDHAIARYRDAESAELSALRAETHRLNDVRRVSAFAVVLVRASLVRCLRAGACDADRGAPGPQARYG
jgi:hypothetical protein